MSAPQAHCAQATHPGTRGLRVRYILARFGNSSVWSRMCRQVPSQTSSVWIFNRRVHAVHTHPLSGAREISPDSDSSCSDCGPKVPSLGCAVLGPGRALSGKANRRAGRSRGGRRVHDAYIHVFLGPMHKTLIIGCGCLSKASVSKVSKRRSSPPRCSGVWAVGAQAQGSVKNHSAAHEP